MRNKTTGTFGWILWETKLQEHFAGFYEKQNYRNIWLDFMRNKITGTFGFILWETKLQENMARFYEKQNYRNIWLDFMRNKITGTFGWILRETKLQEHFAGFYEKQNYRNIWLDFMRNKITGTFGWIFLWDISDCPIFIIWNFVVIVPSPLWKRYVWDQFFLVRTFFKLRDYIRVGFQRPKIYLKASFVS